MSSDPSFPSLPHEEAARFPNPFLNDLRLNQDPRACASVLQEALPVVEFIPLEPAPAWWFYGTHLSLGGIEASAWTAKPLRLRFGERRELLALFCYGGVQSLRQASQTWRITEGSCLLMAGGSCTLEASLSSVVAFTLSEERLLHTAKIMGGLHKNPKDWQQTLKQAHGWCLPEDPAVPSMLLALQQLMAMAGQLSGFGSGLLGRLQLDDQIYRMMAAMVFPELREEQNIDRLLNRQRQGRDAFDELIDYIQQNLSEPLTLSILESHSHYSRRALQYAFVERMGCTATQWIRNQRLDFARQRLENPRPNDSVGSISRECGYRSLGLFSVDFQQRFHVKPSQLLRESRAARGETVSKDTSAGND